MGNFDHPGFGLRQNMAAMLAAILSCVPKQLDSLRTNHKALAVRLSGVTGVKKRERERERASERLEECRLSRSVYFDYKLKYCLEASTLLYYMKEQVLVITIDCITK